MILPIVSSNVINDSAHAFYPMDSDFNDYYGNYNYASSTASIGSSNCVLSSCGQFGGSNDVDYNSLGLTGAWWNCKFVTMTSLSGSYAYTYYYTVTTGATGGTMEISDACAIGFYDGGAMLINAEACTTGDTYFVCEIYDGAGTYSIFINGTNISSSSGADLDVTNFMMGQRGDNGQGHLTGAIDHFVWFNGSEFPYNQTWADAIYNSSHGCDFTKTDCLNPEVTPTATPNPTPTPVINYTITESNLIEINEAISMLWITIFYIGLLAIGFIAVLHNSYAFGLGLIFCTTVLDVYFWDTYGQDGLILGVFFACMIFVKVSSVWYIRSRKNRAILIPG